MLSRLPMDPPPPVNTRSLTPGERTIALQTFGGSLDPDHVQIARTKWFWFQPRETLMTPSGCIHCHPKGHTYSADYAAEPWPTRGLFVHELAHAWQWQHGIPLAWVRWPFARYRYRLQPGKAFADYGLEQQAEIVRHWYLQGEGLTNLAWPNAAALKAVLPFHPVPCERGWGR